MKLKKEFYLKNGVELAKSLLGKVLVHETKDGITKGIIVETEAYMGEIDAAAHSYKNKNSKRTEIQFKEGGYAYIYMIYGMYYCMNVVANQENICESVLVRALEPIDGIEIMKQRRRDKNLFNLCSGPGKLCQAMNITKEQYGIDLCKDQLYIEEFEGKNFDIEATKRLNIEYAKDASEYLWRFIIKENKFVSKSK